MVKTKSFTVLVVFALLTSLAHAQPEWDTTLGNPGIFGRFLGTMVAWDDGTGEKLYVGGSAKGIGAEDNHYVAQFDPETGKWSALGRGVGNPSRVPAAETTMS